MKFLTQHRVELAPAELGHGLSISIVNLVSDLYYVTYLFACIRQIGEHDSIRWYKTTTQTAFE